MGKLWAFTWVVTTIPAGEVFEALAVGAWAIENMAKGIGWRGGVASLDDVDQQPGGIAITFGRFELRFPSFDIGGGEMGEGSQGGALWLADAGVLQ